ATSDPGDYVGGGQSYFLTPAEAPFTASASPDGTVTVSLGGSNWWQLVFAPPASAPLSPGVYEGATRWPFQSPTGAGLDVTATGRGCNLLSGRFTVLEASVAPDGTVTSFAADFEQHCENHSPALIGSIRFNSSFDASARMSVAPAAAYEGDGEPRSLTFVVSLSARSPIAASASYATSDGTAVAGTDYAATSGTVTIPAGETSATIDVPIYGNTLAQPNRSFTLSLSSPAGVVLAFGQATGTILDDDTGKTFLEFESDPGDYIGLGQTFTVTPLDTTIAPKRSGGGVVIDFNLGSSFWNLSFMPRLGAPLVPGVYEGTVSIPNPVQPGFFVWGDARACASTGRFVVFEAQYSPSGDVEALAIDYEQHCDDPTSPALFGSVRFNSLVPTGVRLSVAPAATFEGDGEPQFLTFDLSLTRRTAVDVSVDYATGGGTALDGTDYLPASGTVAIPKGQTTSQVKVRVLGNTTPQPDRSVGFTLSNPVGAALGFGTTTGTIVDDDAITSWIRLDSEAGDWVGGGEHVNLRPPLDGAMSTSGDANGIAISFSGFQSWDFHFVPPQGRTLTVGAFEGAMGWPFQSPASPGLSAYGQGRGCDTVTGRFDVLQADYGPSGNVVALAIDAEQHCEGMAPALWASVRINSAIPVHKRPAATTLAIAFGAPQIALSGTTSLTFNVANPNPQDVLTGVAVADALPAGLVVATPNGLTGSCGGGVLSANAGGSAVLLSGAVLQATESCTFAVNVTGAAAGFYNDHATVTSTEGGSGKDAVASLKVGLPPPVLYFASDPGDIVGQGHTFTLTEADGTLTATASATGGAFLHFNAPGYSAWWDLSFVPPAGAAFGTGVYEGATRWPSPVRPGFDVSGNGAGCNTSTGRFSVLEEQFGPAGEIQVLAIDYEQHCDGAGPALFGSIRYNSLLDTGPRLSVAPAAAYEGDGEPSSLPFWISLSARPTGSVSVDYTTSDGSAKAGTDYINTSGTATFAAGQTAVLVNVPILGNAIPQPDRGLELVLSNPGGAPIAFGEATGTILDDDSGRTFLDLASDPGEPVSGGA
ncbi:MAG TPA: Calx-beta domain-containing protein, partial [Thermoanaerobaculia bacterium]|nr:Calx-beta domain-containing protein [Thermoanaerobaculia bacterium]